MNIIEKYPLFFCDYNINNNNNNERYNQAWIKARQAAEILKKCYLAEKVILFGSLLHKTSFDFTSDIDLAVSGIPDSRFYKAVGTIMQVVTPFEIDLVDINDCRESIKKTIESEGVAL